MTIDVLRGLREELEVAPDVEVRRNPYGYRIVRDGEDTFLRRVTTLLRGIPKDWLSNWVAKTVAEFAVDRRDAWSDLPRTDAVKLLKGSPWSVRDDAADRGSAIHAALEAHLRREDLPEMNDEERECAKAARQFLEARGSRILASELTVINLSLGYAGTLDLWDVLDGVSWCLDWKSSASVYTEHAVQQAAYANAEYAVVQKRANGKEHWTGKLIPWRGVVERMGVVHVGPGKATLHAVREDAHERLWDVFRAAAFVKKWQLDTDSYGGKVPREVVYDPVETQ